MIAPQCLYDIENVFFDKNIVNGQFSHQVSCQIFDLKFKYLCCNYGKHILLLLLTQIIFV